MAFKLPKLPYEYGDLMPHIDKRTARGEWIITNRSWLPSVNAVANINRK